MVELLALLLYVWKVPGLKFESEDGVLSFLECFPQFFAVNSGVVH